MGTADIFDSYGGIGCYLENSCMERDGSENQSIGRVGEWSRPTWTRGDTLSIVEEVGTGVIIGNRTYFGQMTQLSL
jgi:hypothetical protein